MQVMFYSAFGIKEKLKIQGAKINLIRFLEEKWNPTGKENSISAC